MKCETEINFVQQLLNNFGLSFHIIRNQQDLIDPLPDYGLRKALISDYNYVKFFDYIREDIHPNMIYRLKDISFCNYFLFRVPDEHEDAFILIGPYTLITYSQETLLSIVEEYSFPPDTIPQLEKYCQNIPHLGNETVLLTLLYTLGEKLWDDINNFSIQDFQKPFNSEQRSVRKQEEPFLSIQVLEKRYEEENGLLQAVTSGQLNKADSLYQSFHYKQLEVRTADPLRNRKNYSIILNTLLRKAAEQGSVHPLHIDSISSQFAREIELCASPGAVEELNRRMVRQYCLLVKNHSLKGYSPLIQKALTLIDADITADLSLYAQARQLNVNSSYLSTLFKETLINSRFLL
ncbi:MAG: hypothetical protein ACI4EG_14935 [Fusicatenibacter sp.]